MVLVTTEGVNWVGVVTVDANFVLGMPIDDQVVSELQEEPHTVEIGRLSR